jgi:hypothetical protein
MHRGKVSGSSPSALSLGCTWVRRQLSVRVTKETCPEHWVVGGVECVCGVQGGVSAGVVQAACRGSSASNGGDTALNHWRRAGCGKCGCSAASSNYGPKSPVGPGAGALGCSRGVEKAYTKAERPTDCAQAREAGGQRKAPGHQLTRVPRRRRRCCRQRRPAHRCRAPPAPPAAHRGPRLPRRLADPGRW